ncbi:NAD-dependent epimerase/dehydratase family protein, partial [Nocardia tengchongensis]|uniref:NAD-dependent epimerase/dehydratase family protein n=1 Tax=Nocardia tengchongensis TaxID=2055889 RepID=UPI003699315C
MKVLVTGASGFLGGALTRRLVGDGRHEVSILVRPSSNLRDLAPVMDRVERVVGDLGDPASLERAVSGVDIVFHSAARVDERGTRDRFWAENTAATAPLLAAAAAGGARRCGLVSSTCPRMESVSGG